MSKLYTLDEKLLVGCPEVMIKGKRYPVDDRAKTVRKVIEMGLDDGNATPEQLDEVMQLAFGKNYTEIAGMDIPFAAYMELFKLTMAAMTGQDPDDDGGR